MSLSVPFVIYQQVTAGQQFTKSPPEAGPERTLDGVVQKYPNRMSGGYFKFADNLFFEVKRIVADFKDASSWSIAVRHQITSASAETPLSPLLSATKQSVSFTVTAPGADGTYTITINGTDYVTGAVSSNADAIASALQVLVDADPDVAATVASNVVTVTSRVAGSAFTFSSSSSGDPIVEAVVSENAGSFTSSLIRLDMAVQLLPTEAIVVETAGATEAMSCEVLGFPSISNYSYKL